MKGPLQKVFKKSHTAEKPPLVSSRFVCYVKQGKKKRGTVCTNLDACPRYSLIEQTEQKLRVCLKEH